jgi:hypothetical protein
MSLLPVNGLDDAGLYALALVVPGSPLVDWYTGGGVYLNELSITPFHRNKSTLEFHGLEYTHMLFWKKSEIH